MKQPVDKKGHISFGYAMRVGVPANNAPLHKSCR